MNKTEGFSVGMLRAPHEVRFGLKGLHERREGIMHTKHEFSLYLLLKYSQTRYGIMPLLHKQNKHHDEDRNRFELIWKDDFEEENGLSLHEKETREGKW
jgi:hypothetical protein